MKVVPDALCGQLAAFFCTDSAATSRGDKIQFQNIRVCDNVTLWLSYLGFLAPPAEEGKRWPYELVADAGAMPDLAAQSLHMAEADKQALLDKIICYAGDCMDIPVTRQWFSVSGASLGLVQLLADFGYAEAREGEFRWTELVGPSMRAAFFWDAAGGSVDDRTFTYPDDAEDSGEGNR